jgi:hypothetical protein
VGDAAAPVEEAEIRTVLETMLDFEAARGVHLRSRHRFLDSLGVRYKADTVPEALDLHLRRLCHSPAFAASWHIPHRLLLAHSNDFPGKEQGLVALNLLGVGVPSDNQHYMRRFVVRRTSDSNRLGVAGQVDGSGPHSSGHQNIEFYWDMVVAKRR